MLIIYSAICVLFLISTILSTPSPRIVYSAIIYNAQDSPTDCNIIWSQPSDSTLESGSFTIGRHEYYLVDEKEIEMDTWTANAVIKQIRCGKLVLDAPFDKVTSPERKWKFRVESDKIVSVGPSS
ncbi:unnamed protein product [Rotaria sordida]|uniref:Uncharacterized protein n=1 Tax=Rotaria sordida TaxID=392033 RepID=A0A818ZQZ7_9BILA|nr:unnamed protein product [Rotaria sordida]CAF1208099.1 unnamed protein product [Rotaria sordida]CAF3771150.1 unnamed protein product [Rotaria sordida]CAF3907365.1 unnamed protein product [Rotaria sordida]